MLKSNNFKTMDNKKQENSKNNDTANLGISCVSESLSDMELKWLVLCGQKTRESKKVDDGRIDYAFNSMFDLLKTNTMFNAEEIERIFWSRMKLLINSR